MLDAWINLDHWSDEQLHHVMRGLANFHAMWWENVDEWNKHEWLIRSDPIHWKEYIHAALAANIKTHPLYVTPNRIPLLEKIVDLYPSIYNELEQQPLTLIHGDCTPRNACFRPLQKKDKLVLYDWALTSIRPPQQDLAKFLLFTIDPQAEMKRIRNQIDIYLEDIQNLLQKKVDREFFHYGFDIANIYYITVYLTVCAWRAESDELAWLFKEFEYRLRFAEIVAENVFRKMP